MDTVYLKKQRCCGCGSCVDKCPVKAITMKYDDEGFLFPNIDHDKCIDCGLCRITCGFKNPKKKDKKYKPQTYLLQHISREKSQSGGAFVGLSDQVLKAGGAIYGCVNIDNDIRHIRATSVSERDLMRGSKYVQSDMQGICNQIDGDLKNGIDVMFVGTPCQAAGVNNFFKDSKYKDKLYVVDLVCHGTPSPLVLKEYIKWIEAREKERVTDFVFKDISQVGWGGSHVESYKIKDEYRVDHIWRDIFYNNIAMRESCGQCPYSTIVRNSDLTICDAWQIEKRNPEMHDKLGTSLVMIHSEQGMRLWDSINPADIIIKKVDIDDYMQVNMFMPSKINKKLRSNFLSLVYEDFEKALEDFYKNTHFNKLDQLYIKLDSRIRKFLYRGIKREFQFIRRKRG